LRRAPYIGHSPVEDWAKCTLAPARKQEIAEKEREKRRRDKAKALFSCVLFSGLSPVLPYQRVGFEGLVPEAAHQNVGRPVRGAVQALWLVGLERGNEDMVVRKKKRKTGTPRQLYCMVQLERERGFI
jgi:hypothetical protein